MLLAAENSFTDPFCFVLFCWKFWFLPLIRTCKMLNEWNIIANVEWEQAALWLVLECEGTSGIRLPAGLCHLTGHMGEHGKCEATGETCGHESISNYSLDWNRLAIFLSSGIIYTWTSIACTALIRQHFQLFLDSHTHKVLKAALFLQAWYASSAWFSLNPVVVQVRELKKNNNFKYCFFFSFPIFTTLPGQSLHLTCLLCQLLFLLDST